MTNSGIPTTDTDGWKAWAPLIEAVATASGPDAQKHQLLKHALRLVTWSYRPTLASPEVAEHIREEHPIWLEHGRGHMTCDHRFMERAHPVDVAALARDVAARAVSVSVALGRLSPIVWLTREQHRAVGDFGTREELERALGASLVAWREAAYTPPSRGG